MTDFSQTRQRFSLPENQVYLDGNSLGPIPLTAVARVQHTMEAEWGAMLIKAWNAADWMNQPDHLGNRISPIIGAPADTVTTGDTLSIKVFQALSSALMLRPERKVIVSDSGNFPTDLYMAKGLIDLIGKDYELRIVKPEEVEQALTDEVAVMMLTHVDYRTGRMHDMQALTKRAHQVGALTVWDLAHSAGAVPTDLFDNKADFAIGCTYKFLNGGPGAPAFIYVHPDHIGAVSPALSGWLGHAQPFAFDMEYTPASGIQRFRVGTPSVLAMASLDAALDAWDDVDINDVHARSIELSELLIEEVAKRCPALTLASPTDPAMRGSQVSFHCEFGYPLVQALIAADVVGDFRAPDIVRFGITPLYIGHDDIIEAVNRLAHILDTKAWDKPEYHIRQAVT